MSSQGSLQEGGRGNVRVTEEEGNVRTENAKLLTLKREEEVKSQRM